MIDTVATHCYYLVYQKGWSTFNFLAQNNQPSFQITTANNMFYIFSYIINKTLLVNCKLRKYEIIHIIKSKSRDYENIFAKFSYSRKKWVKLIKLFFFVLLIDTCCCLNSRTAKWMEGVNLMKFTWEYAEVIHLITLVINFWYTNLSL